LNQPITETNPSTSSGLIPQPIDFNAIKQRQQATWASGDYATIGQLIQIVGETLVEAVDLRAGQRVLDVAAGNGNASLAAARRFAHVTSTDFVKELLDRGAERARAERFDIHFEVADAENLPYADGSFDVALSTFGVMFTPQHRKAAGELLRVVRSRGRIGLANWTPEGFLGDLFRTIGKYVPPAPGVPSPMAWGSEPNIVQMFGPDASDIDCQRRPFNFRFESAAHWIQVFRTYYGPINKAYGTLEPKRQDELTKDLTELLERHNVGGRHSLVVPSEYLQVVITRK
jgi:SAM-dependent methyltransferase